MCSAQAGVSVDQGGIAPVEFGEECFGESIGEPDGPCAMAVEEADELDSALDSCEGLEGLGDEEHAKRKSLKDLIAQGLRHPHRKLKAADVALGSLAIDIAGPYKEGFGGYKYGLIGGCLPSSTVVLDCTLCGYFGVARWMRSKLGSLESSAS